ncbi:hypothetical protein PNOK_0191600 [Pyrrhoderma noxium]|uniref:RTA1-domain-containing protein n=1 Tax=Pyrrhoderma noxium TaxID=2282107 RepID=A0A286UQZ4_9AGAM|nr:hypothetical protein PNOK_0191600 [Pyrrhoderma noxium]
MIYGYIPNEAVCLTFIVLFGVSTLLHLVQSLYFRLWWLLPTAVLAGLGEVIGWAGRYWSSQTYQGNLLDPYLMQITCTIISPTPLLAANFVILGTMIKYLGSQYSRLSPKWYSIIFCGADIVALVIQSVGGASASSAARDDGNTENGSHIMLIGIIIQMVAIVIYVALASEFLFRYFTKRPVRNLNDKVVEGVLDRKIKLMIFGLSLSTLCIFIRAVYRTIELTDGWDGAIITNELYFNVLDGAMIVLAIYTVNILHPGFLLSHVVMRNKEVEKFGSQETVA